MQCKKGVLLTIGEHILKITVAAPSRFCQILLPTSDSTAGYSDSTQVQTARIQSSNTMSHPCFILTLPTQQSISDHAQKNQHFKLYNRTRLILLLSPWELEKNSHWLLLLFCLLFKGDSLFQNKPPCSHCEDIYFFHLKGEVDLSIRSPFKFFRIAKGKRKITFSLHSVVIWKTCHYNLCWPSIPISFSAR